jgi:hypothetical protein
MSRPSRLVFQRKIKNLPLVTGVLRKTGPFLPAWYVLYQPSLPACVANSSDMTHFQRIRELWYELSGQVHSSSPSKFFLCTAINSRMNLSLSEVTHEVGRYIYKNFVLGPFGQDSRNDVM